MNKLAEKITGGNLAPLDDLHEQLAMEKPVSPMDIFILIKRAESALEGWRKNLTGDANRIFRGLVDADMTKKEWTWNQLATLARYAPAGTWEYPKEVVDLEYKLKQAKASAQANGTAKKTTPKPSDQIPLFSVHLADSDE